MNVVVFGLWHLGAVTAGCLADAGFQVIGLEDDPAAAARLSAGQPPLFEPGLADLFRSGLDSGALRFTADAAVARDADLVWVTYDTPVDDDDRADVAFVLGRIESLFPHLRDDAVVLISSQLPVGSVAEIERRFGAVAAGRRVSFACSPENLRLGRAIEVFRAPERVIVGLRGEVGKNVISAVFAPFSSNIIWVGIEAAEVTKHAINAFLATCVTFINEIASVCEQVGADAREVEHALRSEPRIGPKAYIRPGAAFAGGTLARDVRFVGEIGRRHGLLLAMIDSILESNRFHSDWPFRRLRETLGELTGRRVAVLGLAYKPGTDAIRRSLAVALCRRLAETGAHVAAFDPLVRSLPDMPPGVSLAASPIDAFRGSEALVVMTEWPEFQSAVTADAVAEAMGAPVVLDQNGFLHRLGDDRRIRYLTVGRP